MYMPMTSISPGPQREMASSIDHASEKKQIQKQPGSETHLIFESRPIMSIADSHEKKKAETPDRHPIIVKRNHPQKYI
jgi:hypothetical protein